jgi:hypothetical protein
MFGEVEATIRGALWPYFAVVGYQTHQLSTDTSLSDSEWTALERVLPTLKKPTFDSADLDTGRAVLDGFTTRTGHRPNATELEAQLRFNQEILEWPGHRCCRAAERKALAIAGIDQPRPTLA